MRRPATGKLTFIIFRLFLFFHLVFVFFLRRFFTYLCYSLLLVVLSWRLAVLGFFFLSDERHFFFRLFWWLLFRDVLVIREAGELMLAVQHLLLEVDALEMQRQLAHSPSSEESTLWYQLFITDERCYCVDDSIWVCRAGKEDNVFCSFAFVAGAFVDAGEALSDLEGGKRFAFSLGKQVGGLFREVLGDAEVAEALLACYARDRPLQSHDFLADVARLHIFGNLYIDAKQMQRRIVIQNQTFATQLIEIQCLKLVQMP